MDAGPTGGAGILRADSIIMLEDEPTTKLIPLSSA